MDGGAQDQEPRCPTSASAATSVVVQVGESLSNFRLSEDSASVQQRSSNLQRSRLPPAFRVKVLLYACLLHHAMQVGVSRLLNTSATAVDDGCMQLGTDVVSGGVGRQHGELQRVEDEDPEQDRGDDAAGESPRLRVLAAGILSTSHLVLANYQRVL